MFGLGIRKKWNQYSRKNLVSVSVCDGGGDGWLVWVAFLVWYARGLAAPIDGAISVKCAINILLDPFDFMS